MVDKFSSIRVYEVAYGVMLGMLCFKVYELSSEIIIHTIDRARWKKVVASGILEQEAWLNAKEEKQAKEAENSKKSEVSSEEIEQNTEFFSSLEKLTKLPEDIYKTNVQIKSSNSVD